MMKKRYLVPLIFSGLGLPSRADIVALYRQSKVATSGTAYTDVRPGAGTYEAGKGVSLAIDTPQTITFAGIDAGVTVTSHDGTATVALSSGTLSCSVAGSIYHLTLSDGTTYTCAQGTGGYIVNDQGNGIDGTLVGFTLPAAWTEDIEFGHDWSATGYLETDGSGTYVAGTKLPLLFVGTESGTAYTGEGRNNMLITGVTGDWDGIVYLTNAGLVGTETVVTSTGTSTPTVSAGRIDFTAGTCSYLLLSNGDEIIIESRKDGAQPSVWDRINGNEYVLVGATFGVDGFWSVKKAGSKLLEGGWTEGEVVDVEKVVNKTFDTDTDWIKGTGWTISYGAARHTGEVASYVRQSILGVGKFYEIIVEVLEANATNYVQLYIGESPSVAIWQAPGTYTKRGIASGTTLGLALRGTGDVAIGSVSAKEIPIGLIPRNPNTGLSALGQPLTQLPGKFLDDVSIVYAPETKAFYDLAVLAGLEEALYLDGVAIGKTPDEWIALIPTGNIADCLFRSDTKDTFMVGWNPALTGNDITKAERYLGVA